MTLKPGAAEEALSSQARAFFYAGARGLLVTHWALGNAASVLMAADTLRQSHCGPGRPPTCGTASYLW